MAQHVCIPACYAPKRLIAKNNGLLSRRDESYDSAHRHMPLPHF